MIIDTLWLCLRRWIHLHPAIIQFPAALKANKKVPDSPSFLKSCDGPYQEEFLEAMRTDVTELEPHNCWDSIVSATKIPTEGAKVIPTMWVFKIKKHYPDGRVRRFKAHLKETKLIFVHTTFESKSLRSRTSSTVLGQSFARCIGKTTWFQRESNVSVSVFL
jgi:hypothetical protein